MSKILFTNDQITTIIDLYTKEGKTQKEISKIFNCSLKPIQRILKENHIPSNIRRTNRMLKENYFSEINNASKAYLIGLLFADGNIIIPTDREAQIRIQLLNEDIHLLNFFKKEINSLSKIIDNKDNTSTFGIRSNKIADDLKKYNIVPNKTYCIKTLPHNIPDEYYLDFLRGYIDGDGSYILQLKITLFI